MQYAVTHANNMHNMHAYIDIFYSQSHDTENSKIITDYASMEFC